MTYASYTSGIRTKARPRGRFAVATKNLPSRVLHLIESADAVWGRPWPRRALVFERLSATMMCGRRLASVSIHHVPPAQFELCNYCLIAELGLDSSPVAPAILARLAADELDQVERSLGVPVSRAVRRARIQAGAA